MNKLITLSGVLFLCFGCASQNYFLPDFEEVHATPYGAYIKLKTDRGMIVTGELLTVEANNVVIGSPELQRISVIDTLHIKEHYIQFAKYKRYGYPVLISFTHGLWLVFTVPINAIITQITNAQERKELRFYQYKFNELKSFTRFPQGVPDGFSLETYVPPSRERDRNNK